MCKLISRVLYPHSLLYFAKQMCPFSDIGRLSFVFGDFESVPNLKKPVTLWCVLLPAEVACRKFVWSFFQYNMKIFKSKMTKCGHGLFLTLLKWLFTVRTSWHQELNLKLHRASISCTFSDGSYSLRIKLLQTIGKGIKYLIFLMKERKNSIFIPNGNLQWADF